jgi:hypothetical protein
MSLAKKIAVARAYARGEPLKIIAHRYRCSTGAVSSAGLSRYPEARRTRRDKHV